MSNNFKILNKNNTTVVCFGANLLGNVTISEGCVVHPRSIINASKGPILIGENTIIEENTIIVNNQ